MRWLTPEAALAALALAQGNLGELLSIGGRLPKSADEWMRIDFWREDSGPLLEDFMSKRPKAEIAEWRKRAVKVSDLLAAIQTVEDKTVHALVQDFNAQLVRAVLTPLVYVAWLGENAVALEYALFRAGEAAGEAYLRAIAERPLVPFWPSLWDDIQAGRIFRRNPLWIEIETTYGTQAGKIIDAAGAAGMAELSRYAQMLAINAVGSLVAAFLTREAITRTFAPVAKERFDAVAKLKKKWLPQRTVKRVRRCKRSRRKP